jgi:hypothetical protein
MTTLAILLPVGLCFVSLYFINLPASVGEGLVNIKEEVE